MHFPATLCAILALVSVAAGRAQAPAPMRYIHNAPESPLDHRHDYTWKILATALERTRTDYGDYVLQAGAAMNESRQVNELRRAAGTITVMYRGITTEQVQDFIPVLIPVDKGLAGYGVFLVRKERVAQFAPITTLDALKQFRFGHSLSQTDVRILRASGLKVATGSNYEGLFDMLNNDRFDVLLRAVAEVQEELESRKASFPELELEPRLILHYPMPMYFWFSKTDEGRRLARRAEAGMRAMISDGSYDRIFAEYHDRKIQGLGLAQRVIIGIPNPNLGPETPLSDRSLWFEPANRDSTARR